MIRFVSFEISPNLKHEFDKGMCELNEYRKKVIEGEISGCDASFPYTY